MPKVSVTMDVEVDPDWIEFCTSRYVDVFMHGYCGYWMCGVEHDDKLGWLVSINLDDEGTTAKETKKAVKAWKDGKELPEGWYRLNEEVACKAWAEGFKRWGATWYEDGDADTYDYAIQKAMFGEVVYG